MQETASKRVRGSAAQPPPKDSAKYANILRRAAAFALEINANLASDKTIWSFGQIAAARKSLAERCQNSQHASDFKRTDDTFYSETQIWDILNEGVQSWQEASVNRNKTEIQQQEIHNPAHLGRRHTIEGRLQVHIGTRARHVA